MSRTNCCLRTHTQAIHTSFAFRTVVRAAVAWNEETASLARRHNNANVLAIGARTTPNGEIPNIIKAWFNADFEGGRHAARVDKITATEALLKGDTSGK